MSRGWRRVVEEEPLQKEVEEVDRWRTLFGGKRDLEEEEEREGREREGFFGVHLENTVRPRSPILVVGGKGVEGGGRGLGTPLFTAHLAHPFMSTGVNW